MVATPATRPAVTTPVTGLTVASEDDVLHAPTPVVPVALKVITAAAQTLLAPEMVPAAGNGLTTIAFVVLSDPQLGVTTLYLMMALPIAAPPATPAALMVAILELEDQTHRLSW